MAQMDWDAIRKEAEKTGGFAPHPIGRYRFKVIEASLKKGSTGNNQILARLENMDAGPNQGKTVLNNMSPMKNDGTPNGMFFQQLGALGFTEDHPLYAALSGMDADQGIGYIATNIVGKEAMCEITHREWANETRDNVKKMTPVDTNGVVPAQAPQPGVVPAAPAPVAAVPVPVAPAPAPVVPVAPVAAPVAPVPAPVAPAPAVVPVAAPVDNTVQQVPAGVPVMPAPVQPAAEPVAAPTTVEAVVAQIPVPPATPIPTPPNRPF